MSLDSLIGQWREVRNGFIEEVSQVPPDKFNFQPAADTRTPAQLLQHIIETQKVLVGELCRADTNFGKGFPALMTEHASGVSAISDKDALIALLRESMDQSETRIRDFGEQALQEMTTRFDGKAVTKYELLNLITAHEMYHRGQFTVYERLLNIEPALTTKLKKLFAARG